MLFQDPFPGEAPVPEEKKEKYRRTDQVKSVSLNCDEAIIS